MPVNLKLCKNIVINTERNIICFGYLLEWPQRGDSSNYPKHMSYEEIRMKQGLFHRSFCLLRILFNSKLMFMVTSLGTSSVIVTRVHYDNALYFYSAGTHWGFEIISMLLNGTAESVPLRKVALMLENTPESELEKLPSPRVLNSHLPMCMLPKQIKGIVNQIFFFLCAFC